MWHYPDSGFVESRSPLNTSRSYLILRLSSQSCSGRKAAMLDLPLLVDRLRTGLVSSQRHAHTMESGPLSTWPAQLVSLCTQKDWRTLWRSAFPVIGFAAAYLAGYVYGNGLPSPAPLPAPFWPPDAILLSALLLVSPRRWWIYLLITFPIRMVP